VFFGANGVAEKFTLADDDKQEINEEVTISLAVV